MDSPNLDHLSIPYDASVQKYSRKPTRLDPRIREVEHRAHGQRILNQLQTAFDESTNERKEYLPTLEELRSIGSIIVLEGSNAKFPLALDDLTRLTTHKVRRIKWILLSAKAAADDSVEMATVWVADDYRSDFLKKFEAYSQSASEIDGQKGSKKEPKNAALVANTSSIRSAILSDLWTSTKEIEYKGTHWWEIWLHPQQDAEEKLRKFVELFGLNIQSRHFEIQDRLIFWVEATWSQLQPLLLWNVPVAEIRKPMLFDTIEDLPLDEQSEYVKDFYARIKAAPANSVAVCLLDTGVNRQHQLLRDSLFPSDIHNVFGTYSSDKDGHGTAMAGIALFKDLDDHLLSTQYVVLKHRLESVRMRPDSSIENVGPESYGSITAEAISRAEAAANRKRVFNLTISTTPDSKPGEPTLWSASIDALAFGAGVTSNKDGIQLFSGPKENHPRLILIAGGNVREFYHNYLDISDARAIEDPGQAWNALTVGAYTEKTVTPTDPQYRGWCALAKQGELSPHSRTSVPFGRKWPNKPDICFEGGNLLFDPSQLPDLDQNCETNHPNLSIRTTGITNDQSLTSANATSSATAQASRLAALAMDKYPDYRPETIRALLTHRAEWTPKMLQNFSQVSGKRNRQVLLRRYGWGVPTESAVLHSMENSPTLIDEDQIKLFRGPNKKNLDEFVMDECRLHSLPWPSNVLENLGSKGVRLRVTLSYFVQPSASRRGWRQRYSYQSHSLRFEIKKPLESTEAFILRMNALAQAEEAGSLKNPTGEIDWVIGPNQRNHGSLHQDEWETTGAELAQCDAIAVYPVGGWWKTNKIKERLDAVVPYSLMISLKTEEGIDLYTPIANQIEIATPANLKIPIDI